MTEKKGKLELYITPNGYGSTIKIDGVHVPHVRRVEVVAALGEDVTFVRLEVLALEGIEIYGDVRIKTVTAAMKTLWICLCKLAQAIVHSL